MFRQKLVNMENAISKFNGEIIVAGDFNAKSAEWDADFSDTKGNEVADISARLGLIVLGTESTTTFRRPGYQESILDISMGMLRIASEIQDRESSKDFSGNDHQYIRFSI